MKATSREPAAGPRRTATPRTAPRRLTGLVAGLVLAVCSIGLIGTGAYAAAAGAGGTYVGLGGHGRYHSDRYGLATESTDWRSSLFGWAGKVRLKVAPAGHEPIFVGIAPAGAIHRYLEHTGYTTIGADGRARTDHDGRSPGTAATSAIEWTARSEGSGIRTLAWTATGDHQVAYAMNADGSPAVDVRIVSSAVTLDRMPWEIPAVLLAAGLALVPVTAVVIRRSVRASHQARRA